MRTKFFRFADGLLFASIALPVLLSRISVTTRTIDPNQNFWQPTNGPHGGYVMQLAVHPANGDIFAGLGGGVFRSTDNGKSWAAVNKDLINREVRAFAMKKSNGEVFAGTAGGVFRVPNSGGSWIPFNTGLTNQDVMALAIRELNGDIFAGTSTGVFRFANNGVRWDSVNTGLPTRAARSVQALSIQADGDIFAGTTSGVFRLQNNGAVWDSVNTGLTSKTVRNIRALAINTNGDIFAGTAAGVFRLQDNGAGWEAISTGLTNKAIQAMTIKTNGDLFAGTSTGVFHLPNNSSNWKKVADLPDNNIIALISKADQYIFAGTLCGVFLSLNDGASWEEAHTGMIGYDFSALAINSKDEVFTGTRALALSGCGSSSSVGAVVFRSSDGGGSWEKVKSGLPGSSINTLAINKSKGDIWAGTSAYGVYQSLDNGASWRPVNAGLAQTTVLALAAKSDGEVVAGTSGGGVFRLRNNSTRWDSLNAGLASKAARTIRALALNSKEDIFAGNNIGVFRLNNNSSVWIKSGNGLPDTSIVPALALNSRGHIFVGILPDSRKQITGGVFRSLDDGANWTLANTGLTNKAIRAFAINSNGVVFAATSSGVFYSIDNGDHWTQANGGLTSIDVLSLAIDSQDIVFAGIAAGGVARSIPPAPSPTTIKPAVMTPQAIGAEFFVDVTVSNVQNLFGVSFDLNYTNTAYVDYVAATRGDFMGNDVVFFPTPDDVNGKVSIGISRKSPAGGVNGSGVVARIKLKSLATTPTGTQVSFSLSNVIANDPSGGAISLAPASVTVAFTGVVVWPGDTNNDRVVNAADVLPIGLYWNKTGPPRPNASCNWIGQPASPWVPEASTYADANGDGKIDQADILCIGRNWNKTHGAAALAVAKTKSPPILGKAGDACIGYTLVGGTSPGQEFWVDVHVKDIANLFGVSFELLYSPTAHVDPQTTEAGSFMGSEVIFFPNVDKNAGKISLAISQKAPQSGVSGSGVVARIKMRISNNAPLQTPVTITLQNIVANDPAGVSIPLPVCTTGVEQANQTSTMPEAFALHAAAPNPFNPSTTIKYDLPQQAEVKLMIFDMLGRHVRTLVNQTQQAGRYAITWDGRNEQGQQVASGTFIYQLRAGTFTQRRRMALVR